MTLYTKEVQQVFQMVKAPYPGFIVDVVEYPGDFGPGTGWLGLRVYRDNVESFSDPQKIALSEYLFRLRDTIQDLGVQAHIEGVEHGPPNRR